MDVSMIDREQLAATNPEDVSLYLANRGWTEVYQDRGGSAWSTPLDDSPELWIPRSRSMRGYLNRVADLIGTLGRFESRSPAELLFEILHAYQDVQLIRTLPDAPSGSVALEHGSETLTGITKWVHAAAGSIAAPSPTPVLSGRPSASVDRFMSQVHLVTPERGSFVWRVAVPVAEQNGLTSLPFDESSTRRGFATFNRQVTQRLYEATSSALEACRLVNQGEPLLETFRSAANDGVTANLCEGLSATGGEQRTPFEVNFHWAANLAGPNSETLRFGSSEQSIVRRAADELRQVAPEEDVTLRGYIVRLSRESDQRPGIVTLAGTALDDTEQRFGHFRFELDRDDYGYALTSHAERRLVHVRGDIVRRGNRRNLENVREFRIADEQTDASPA